MLRVKSQNMDAYHILLNQMAKDFLASIYTQLIQTLQVTKFPTMIAASENRSIGYFMGSVLLWQTGHAARTRFTILPGLSSCSFI